MRKATPSGEVFIGRGGVFSICVEMAASLLKNADVDPVYFIRRKHWLRNDIDIFKGSLHLNYQKTADVFCHLEVGSSVYGEDLKNIFFSIQKQCCKRLAINRFDCNCFLTEKRASAVLCVYCYYTLN